MINQVQKNTLKLATAIGQASISLSGDSEVLDRNQLVQELMESVNRLNTEAGGSYLTVDEVNEVENGKIKVIFRGDIRHPDLLHKDV